MKPDGQNIPSKTPYFRGCLLLCARAALPTLSVPTNQWRATVVDLQRPTQYHSRAWVPRKLFQCNQPLEAEDRNLRTYLQDFRWTMIPPSLRHITTVLCKLHSAWRCVQVIPPPARASVTCKRPDNQIEDGRQHARRPLIGVCVVKPKALLHPRFSPKPARKLLRRL